MNTTAIVRGKKVRWSHLTPGFVRVNAAMKPEFSTANELKGGVFTSFGVEKYKDSNRLLLTGRAVATAEPEAFLVCLKSELEGKIDFTSRWRRGPVRIVSSSFHDGSQETLLLVGQRGIVTTELGEWEISCSNTATILALK